MVRSFNARQLDNMCKARPESYRTEILAIATPKLGVPGSFDLDTDSEKYRALKAKYAPKPSPVIGSLRADMERKLKERVPARTASRPEVMNLERLVSESVALTELLGPQSEYVTGLGVFIQADRAGACRGCSRGGHLRRLYNAFRKDLDMASKATLTKLKTILGGDYLQIMPNLEKWDDLILKAQ